MTIIEKIKQSVEGATGMPFLYHAAGELNELIARCKELPVAYSFLIDSGTIDDVNGRYHERVTLAVMFCDKTEFDFNALENEQIINRMKVKAYKWLQSLRMSNALRIVAVNNTQRLYDNTTDILTGFAVNITIEDMAGVGECELPQVVIDLYNNGSYDVVGVDKVRVNVVQKLEELEITENGEYLPPIDIAGFSKVVANVLPKTTDLIATENDKEYIATDYGVDGFGKVKTELRNLVKVSSFKVTDDCINEEGRWEEDILIDTSKCTSFSFLDSTKLKYLDTRNWNTSNLTELDRVFDNAGLQGINIVGIENWDVSKVTTLSYAFRFVVFSEPIIDLRHWNTESLNKLNYTFIIRSNNYLNLEGWNTKNVTDASSCFTTNNLTKLNIVGWDFSNCTKVTDFLNGHNLTSCVGDYTINEVIENNISTLIGLKVSLTIHENYHYPTMLNRASLRAIINGLADLTGQTAQTLTLGATLMAKLTEEDIAIGVNKNWTIV